MSRRERQRRRRRNEGGPARPLFLALGVLTTLIALAIVGAVGWVISVANSGPALESLKPQDPGAASEILASDGTRLGFISSDILRTPVTGSKIPDVVRDATVAIEDKRFYDHKGVDFEGVVRAAVKNLESKRDVQGGSTLSMQLIRNLYTKNTTRTGIEGYKRKIREAKLAEELEDRHPGRRGKRYILDTYLNNVPYGTVGGKTAVGIQAAARIFFNKQASDLTLSEAALLAGLPQAPSDYNPFLSREKARARRDAVLRSMASEGFITQEQAAAAMRKGLGVERSGYYTQRRESYFFDYVKSELVKEYGYKQVQAGGMKVTTTIDLQLQQAARKTITDALAGTDKSGTVVSVDPRNGEIKAMASNARYGELNYNLASQGGYAAGSTFKTMVLMTALRKGVDPNSTTYTSMPLKFNDPKYGPIDVRTYSGSYIGRANLVKATLTSDNSIYQQLDLDVGPDQVKQTAKDMGIKSKLNGYPSEGLGAIEHGVSPLEMANSYATIASGGWRNRVTSLRKVCLPQPYAGGFKCETLKPHRHKAFSDGITYEATKILKMNVQQGTGTAAQIGCPAAGKTGTVDDFTDAWFVGYTPRLSTAVWVGHAKDRRTLGAGSAGGTVAAPIWGTYMKIAKGKFCGDFPLPKEPFQAAPFFGRYATTGVKGNQAGSYTTNGSGDQSLETGTDGTGDGTGGTTGGGGTEYPSDQYSAPPQDSPDVQTPQTPQTPATPETPATPDPGGGGTGDTGGTGAPPP
jgi:penicillin-binding protein 1A